MSRESTKLSELAQKVMDAKSAWEDAKLRFEQATIESEYVEKRLVLAHQELILERNRIAPDEDWRDQITQVFGEYADEVLDELRSVELVGEPIGRASRSVLARLRNATVAGLVARMQERGFQFTTDVPARELHGALVKQPWAFKDSKSRWQYVKTAG